MMPYGAKLSDHFTYFRFWNFVWQSPILDLAPHLLIFERFILVIIRNWIQLKYMKVILEAALTALFYTVLSINWNFQEFSISPYRLEDPSWREVSNLSDLPQPRQENTLRLLSEQQKKRVSLILLLQEASRSSAIAYLRIFLVSRSLSRSRSRISIVIPEPERILISIRI